MEKGKATTCRTCSEILKYPRNLCDVKYKPLLDIINRILGYEVHGKIAFFNICDSCECKLKWIVEFKEKCEKSLAKLRNDSNCKREIVDMDDFDLCLEDDGFDYKLDSSILEDNLQSDIETPKSLEGIVENDLKKSSHDVRLKKFAQKRKRTAVGTNKTSTEIFAKNNLIDDSDSDSDIPIKKFKRITIKRRLRRKRTVRLQNRVEIKRTARDYEVENDSLEDDKVKDKVLAQFPHDEVEKALKEFLRPFEMNRQCVVCNTLVSSRKRLAWHMSAMHKDVQDKWCNICNTFAINLEDHKYTHNDLFKCPFCDRICKPEIIPFKGHIEKHSDSPVDWDYYPCKYCPSVFPYVNELKEHQCANAPPGVEQDIDRLVKPKKEVQNKWGKGGKRYKQYSFEQVERALKETLRAFHTVRQCCICGENTKNLQYLTAHIKVKHKKLKDKWCELCNKIVPKLKRHKESHRNEDTIVCPFCQTKFKIKSNLQDHLMNHSNSRHFKPNLDWFICQNCPKAFPYENELNSHESKEHSADPTEEIEKGNVGVAEDKYKNDDGNKMEESENKEEWLIKKVKTRKWSKLEQFPHDVVEKAMKEAMRPFYTIRMCPVCNFLSKNRQSLGTHIGKHKGAKGRWCTRCNTLVNNLEEHKQNHEEYLFNCPFCDKRFNRRDDFNGHLLRHSLTGRKFNEKWYCCPVCPGSFLYEEELKSHICVAVPVIKLNDENTNNTNDLQIDRSDLKAAVIAMKRAKSKLEQFPHEIVEQAMKEAMRPFYTIRECPICEKVMSNRAVLGSHITIYHKEEKEKWCSRCNTLVANLEEHKQQTHEEYLFNCPFCKKEFPERHDLEAHINRHSLLCGRKIERQWFICQYCPRSFPYKTELNNHKCPTSDIEKQNIRQELQTQLKTKMEPSQEVSLKTCPICKKEVKYLTYHLKKAHNKFRKKTGNGKARVKKLGPLPKPHLCSFCGKTFHHKNTLNTHIMSRHTGERPYKCSYCEKGFVSNNAKRNHEDSMHGGERKFFCDVCGKACASYSTLCIHKQIHEEQPPQQCPICEKFYVRPYMLKVHMKRHTEANRFSCAQCNASYHLKRLLLKHLLTHTNERPFKCRFCDKTWRHKVECTVHERVHTGTYPYVCSICSYSTTKAYSLTLHMKQHPEDAPQANNPHKCPMCYRSFSTRALQTSHTKNVHMSFTEKGLRLDYVNCKEK